MEELRRLNLGSSAIESLAIEKRRHLRALSEARERIQLTLTKEKFQRQVEFDSIHSEIMQAGTMKIRPFAADRLYQLHQRVLKASQGIKKQSSNIEALRVEEIGANHLLQTYRVRQQLLAGRVVQARMKDHAAMELKDYLANSESFAAKTATKKLSTEESPSVASNMEVEARECNTECSRSVPIHTFHTAFRIAGRSLGESVVKNATKQNPIKVIQSFQHQTFSQFDCLYSRPDGGQIRMQLECNGNGELSVRLIASNEKERFSLLADKKDIRNALEQSGYKIVDMRLQSNEEPSKV